MGGSGSCVTLGRAEAEKGRMGTAGPPASRIDALDRAVRHSPFLRELAESRSEVARKFLQHGAIAAAELALGADDDSAERLLRRRRQGLALAVALGDLAGELPLEQVTRLLSDFADQAM